MTAMQTRKWFVHRRIFADVESDDRGAESLGEGALGTADAAADIQHAHAGIEPEGLTQIMLVVGHGFREGRAFLRRGEVR